MLVKKAPAHLSFAEWLGRGAVSVTLAECQPGGHAQRAADEQPRAGLAAPRRTRSGDEHARSYEQNDHLPILPGSGAVSVRATPLRHITHAWVGLGLTATLTGPPPLAFPPWLCIATAWSRCRDQRRNGG